MNIILIRNFLQILLDSDLYLNTRNKPFRPVFRKKKKNFFFCKYMKRLSKFPYRMGSISRKTKKIGKSTTFLQHFV